MNSNQQLCTYLKEHDFKDFMELWKKQYEKYGTCSGSIHVPLSDSNQSCLEGLLGKDYHKQSHAVIRRAQLNKALQQTRFSDADFDEVLLLYFDKKVITKKSVELLKQEKYDAFLDLLMDFCSDKYSRQWFKGILDHQKHLVSRILLEYKKSPSNCKKQMHFVLNAIDELPVWRNEKENLSIFSSRITKNPHTFDHHGLCRTLFLNAIIYFFPAVETEREIEVLYKAGLYKEAMSNYCGITRLNAIHKDGKVHAGWKGFYERYEVWNVNMDNLLHITSLDTEDIRIVCMLENPSVFHQLASLIQKERISSIALVCTYGQLNYASYLLMDLISQSSFNMYYAGDMDPEGLMIAQRLKDRYPSLHLWHYSIDDYLKSQSQNKCSQRRLKILENLKDSKLIKIRECIVNMEGMAGYQENIIHEYEKDILKYASAN